MAAIELLLVGLGLLLLRRSSSGPGPGSHPGTEPWTGGTITTELPGDDDQLTRPHRAQELLPVELRPIELLLDALERGVADRAVGPQLDQPQPSRLGRGAHHVLVRLPVSGVGRFGIGGTGEQTLKEIGKELGITKERVRQIEARAQDKLRGLARTGELVALLA